MRLDPADTSVCTEHRSASSTKCEVMVARFLSAVRVPPRVPFQCVVGSCAPMAVFRMSKWYLDCVTESGDVSLAYTGSVRWGPVRLHYASLLESGGEGVAYRHSLRSQTEPSVENLVLRWHSDALDFGGTWTPDAAMVRETIFKSAEGSIEWHCRAPRARARMRERSGLGYVEQLSMTIAPWRIPIRTLRWGRFLTPSEWLVWIGWPRQILYWNGRLVPNPSITDDRLEFDDGARLLLDRSLVLRQGALGATALSVIPGVRDTFPAHLLQVNEVKWRSRARLERPGHLPLEGWAIHERVDWPETPNSRSHEVCDVLNCGESRASR